MKVTVIVEREDGTQHVVKGGGFIGAIFEPGTMEGNTPEVEEFRSIKEKGLLESRMFPVLFYVEGDIPIETVRTVAYIMGKTIRVETFDRSLLTGSARLGEKNGE